MKRGARGPIRKRGADSSPRWLISDGQLGRLFEVFEKFPSPSIYVREALAKEIGATTHQVRARPLAPSS